MAIGAAIGSGRRTLVIHGDGGFMFHATELATAAQYAVPVIVCVFNDRGYGVLAGPAGQPIRGAHQRNGPWASRFRPAGGEYGRAGARSCARSPTSKARYRTALATAGPYLLEIDMLALEPMKGSIAPR